MPVWLPRGTYQSAFPGLYERPSRGPAAFCAAKDALRDTPANIVLFSERSVFANPFQRNMHVGKRSCIEAFLNHGSPRMVDATPATSISPAGGSCLTKRNRPLGSFFPTKIAKKYTVVVR